MINEIILRRDMFSKIVSFSLFHALYYPLNIRAVSIFLYATLLLRKVQYFIYRATFGDEYIN